MNLRRFGKGGLETPPLILGGNVFGWTSDAATSFTVLDAFVAGGGKMIDTADVYSAWVPGNKADDHWRLAGKALATRLRSLLRTMHQALLTQCRRKGAVPELRKSEGKSIGVFALSMLCSPKILANSAEPSDRRKLIKTIAYE